MTDEGDERVHGQVVFDGGFSTGDRLVRGRIVLGGLVP
jgi:phosphoribosylformylglycinamidine (FGAM) synthase-like amidotransferase family enzyme